MRQPSALAAIRGNVAALLAEAEQPSSELHEHVDCFRHLSVTLGDVAELGGGRHAVAASRSALSASLAHLRLILAADDSGARLEAIQGRLAAIPGVL